MSNPKQIQFSATKTSFGVDRENRRLTDVAVITANDEAQGHGYWIDPKCLDTLMDVLPKGAESNIKAYVGHRYWENGDRFLQAPGYFTNFRLVGEKVIADFEFYESEDPNENHEKVANRILEMAEKTPDAFGLSIEFMGYGVFVAEDGTEYSEKPEDTDLQFNGMPCVRITSLDAVSFVSAPAANRGGLFSKVFGKTDPMEKIFKMLEKMAAVDATETDVTETELNDITIMKEIFASIRTKFAKDETKLNRAFAIVGASETPESVTIEAIEAQLASEATATELTALNKQVEDLTAERDQLKAKAKKDGETQEALNDGADNPDLGGEGEPNTVDALLDRYSKIEDPVEAAAFYKKSVLPALA